MGRPRAPGCDLVRLPRAVPGRSGRRGPEPDPRVRERARRHQRRGAGRRSLRGHARELDRRLEVPHVPRLVDVLELGVHGRRADAALRLPPPARILHAVPELDPARERDRARRLRRPADGAAADVPDVRLPGHAGRLRRSEPRERPDPARGEPVRRDAEPPRRRCAHRRHLHGRRLQALVVEGDLAALAGLGLVRRDGDRQPLLARHPRRDRRRGDGGDRGLPAAALAAAPPGARDGVRSGTASIKATYTDGARRLASRSITGLARTRVTPSMLTAAGVSLCALAAVLVYFEYRNEWLFFWLGAVVFVVGSLLDILDGALARAGGKSTPFGAFLDSTTDRIGEAFMLGAIAAALARDGNETAFLFVFAALAGSFLVSYTRSKAEALGLRGDVGIGSRAERVVVITAGLVFAPWGGLQWAVYFLTATAWVTVVQRIWHVRRQLRERAST